MDIVACIKQTIDTEAKIVLDSQGLIEKQGANRIINPYCEIAVEEALRIKEEHNGEVTVITVGGPEAQEILRHALAMGADKAVLIDPHTQQMDEFSTAIILAKVISQMKYDIVLGGFKSIDNGSSQVMGRVAEILGIPVVNEVTKLVVENEKVTAVREMEAGFQELEVLLPAVITAQKGLNDPRYPSIKGIMQAKKKPLETKSLTDIGADPQQVRSKINVISYFLPLERNAGKIIVEEPAAAVRGLVEFLQNEVKIL